MDAKYGNAVEFDIDLHSIYAAYLGHFEAAAQDWWDKSWGGYFSTFNDFLGFSWEVMVVVDARTARAHIAVRRDQIALFAKMIRTRFGESLAKDPPTTLPLNPVPTRTLSLRRLVQISDLAAYRKLSLTLPAAELSHLRHRARVGDVAVAEQLFYAGDPSREGAARDNGVGYTFAAVRTTWWEKGGPPTGLIPGTVRAIRTKGVVLEVGIAAVRCANLRAVDVWPPIPIENYRKSHFIMEEWVDKRVNQTPPSYPRAYSFGKSQFIAEQNVERILDANLAALASQENDSNANTLILLTLGEPSPLPLPTNSTLPANIIHIDVLALEYNLLRRAQEQGVQALDRHAPLTSLASLLHTLQIPPLAPVGNAGNDAYYTLLAFQKLMMAQTKLPDVLLGYPMPQPPFARPPHSRESSSSSRRQSENFVSPRAWNARPTSYGEKNPREDFRQPIARSSTIFWDDAEYADADVSSQKGSIRDQTHLRQVQTGEGSLRAPPSAMRHSTMTQSEVEPDTVLTGQGSGSSTKLDSSESEGKIKVKEKKMKSEKSMRNVAGALARFWVG